MTRVRIHVDGCTCDQPWHHQPPANQRRQARQAERDRHAAARTAGKTVGNARRQAHARRHR